MKVEQRNPSDLTIHPLLKKQPGEWPQDDPRFEALCDDIAARGIDHPLLVDAKNRVADGRHRLRGAKRYQLKEVPVRVIADDEVATVIVQSLLQRRHYNASQRAYLLAPTLNDAFAAAQARMLSGKGGPSALSAEGIKSIDEYAASINVGVKYLRDAHRIHKHFEDDTKRDFNTDEVGRDVLSAPSANGKGSKKIKLLTFREYYEPLILDDHKPMGLGAVLAGIGFKIDSEKKGKPHKGGKPEQIERQLSLFNQVVTDELNRWDYWQNFDDDTKAAHFKTVSAKFATLEVERLEQILDYHTKLADKARKAIKEAKGESK